MTMHAHYVPRAKVVPNLKATFLPFQSRWVADRSQYKLMEKSRQIGLSWSTAYASAREVSQPGPYDRWVSSRDEIQARLFLEDCKKFARILNEVCKDLGEQIITGDNGKVGTAFTLEFASGRRIHSMSSNPDAQAGKRGSRVLDEFALHPDPRKLYAIAQPGITWGGQLEIISTHRGSANFFNKLVQEAKGENRKKFSLHTVTLQDALDQGLLYRLQQSLHDGGADDARLEMDEAAYFDFIRASCADEETFQQEYMCQPADDASAFLPYELIDKCRYKPGESWWRAIEELERSEHDLYLGVDIGRHKDLTVLWLMEKISGVYFTRRLDVLQAMPFSQQEEHLYPLLELPRLRRCCIDSTGLGMQFAERAQQRYGSHRVEAVRFSGAVKEELAYPVRAAFEDGSVRIPDGREVIADLRKIRKETTASGNIRFTADSDDQGHADRFWALALALHAGKDVNGPIAVSGVSMGSLKTSSRRNW